MPTVERYRCGWHCFTCGAGRTYEVVTDDDREGTQAIRDARDRSIEQHATTKCGREGLRVQGLHILRQTTRRMLLRSSACGGPLVAGIVGKLTGPHGNALAR